MLFNFYNFLFLELWFWKSRWARSLWRKTTNLASATYAMAPVFCTLLLVKRTGKFWTAANESNFIKCFLISACMKSFKFHLKTIIKILYNWCLKCVCGERAFVGKRENILLQWQFQVHSLKSPSSCFDLSVKVKTFYFASNWENLTIWGKSICVKNSIDSCATADYTAYTCVTFLVILM